MDLKDLKKKMPCKWRIQACSKNKPKASCVAYIDARQVADLLDDVVGPDNWKDEYKEINGMLFCGISIKTHEVKSGLDHAGSEWVTKWDTGSESNVDKEKGHVSDAFKRAAVKWGVGRFLYEKKIQYVDTNATNTGNNYPYPVTPTGQRIWDLAEYFSKKQ